MHPDNDDCEHLTGIPGRPLAGASVQTVPEWWSFTLEGGDCAGPESGTPPVLPEWLSRPCPRCRAEVGEVCSVIGGPMGGDARVSPHSARVTP